MLSQTFVGGVALLYYLCFASLLGLTLLIVWRGGRRSRTRACLRRHFFLLVLTLLLWQGTLFTEVRVTHPGWQLWLGRANFATIVLTVYHALRFTQAVPAKRSLPASSVSRCLLAETWLLALVTLFTPLISAAERVEQGQAITTYGPLFPLYLLHVVGYLTAALVCAFREGSQTQEPTTRGQLTWIGGGALVTGGIALLTNAALPYAFNDFRFCDVGALSVLFFALSIAYAIFLHRLFDLRLLVRKTLVYGLSLAFVLGTYSSAVFVISQYLTASASQWTQFAVLVIAFSCDPLRRFLEGKTDQLLFEKEKTHAEKPSGRPRSSARVGERLSLALLFPWRRQ